MEEVIAFLLIYIFVYFFYVLFIVKNKKNLGKYETSMELKHLVYVYKIDLKKHDLKKLSNIMAHTNAFIIAVTVSLISLVPIFILKLILGFLMLILLQIFMYFIIGKTLKKKEGAKNV